MKLNNRLNFSNYIKDILTSLSGTTISQAITISMAPVLTRIYQPSDYGLLGIYMSITAILFVFVNFQYSQAILLTEDKKEEDNIVILCYTITLLFSLAITLIILSFYLFEFDFFNNAKLGIWLFFIPISIFFNGCNTIFSKILNKYKKYKGISFSLVVSSITTISFSFSLGLLLKSYEGLFIGFLMGQFSRFIVLYFYTKKLALNF